METIRTYLENMFASLPNTPEVIKAKRELGQMMEDKYSELRENGVSENEAVGTVISEFGSLEELAEDLGIGRVVDETEPAGTFLSMEEVRGYLKACSRQAFLTALAVFLCILSPAFAIIGEMTGSEMMEEAVWPGIMFILLAAALGLFVYSSFFLSRWRYVERSGSMIDYGAACYVEEEKNRYRSVHAMRMTLGVVLLVLSVVPAILTDYLGDRWEDLGGAGLFVFAAAGVYLIVYTVKIMGSFDRILKLNDSGRMAGHYVREQENEIRYEGNTAAVMSVFWPTVTCLYICISFLTFAWHLTWLIWPAAVLADILIRRTLGHRADS